MEAAAAAGAESGPVALPFDSRRLAYLYALRKHPQLPPTPLPCVPLSAAAAEAFCEEELELEAAAAGLWPLLDKNYYNDDAGDAGLPPCGEVDEYLDLTEHDYDLFYKQTQEDQRRPVSCDENEERKCEVPSQPQLRREASNCKAGSGYTASYSRSVSFSSMEAIAVPDTTLSDTTNSYLLHSKGTIDLFSGRSLQLPLHFNSVDRKARVLRYREKRKTRKFEKTIRYASRKAYAESRPRIKGRFVKRSDLALKVDKIDVFSYCDIPR
uniref:CCT domain-containing protein n=1 Tax=Ananas comosus var. bracteatus TaxID=296719 RepID=A0A6V7P787_ANACO|nr:unnamed protein product [Ananas comosus var. bracteatus]